MGRQSQRKGAAGERELVDILQRHGYSVRRGGSQTYGSIPDVVGLPDVHIEVKRTEHLKLHDAMAQSIRDSERFNDGLPAVFHRRNCEDWHVTMLLEDWLKLYERGDPHAC
ncbi:MAG: hypothetical protein IJJ80_01275 [Clostridia bacterium]|nr:hypothetical protein [Clostridia bacterium]